MGVVDCAGMTGSRNAQKRRMHSTPDEDGLMNMITEEGGCVLYRDVFSMRIQATYLKYGSVDGVSLMMLTTAEIQGNARTTIICWMTHDRKIR